MRAPAEGLVAAKDGVLIELNSETDFVAKNAEIQSLAEGIVQAAVSSTAADVDALKTSPISGRPGNKTVEQAIAELSAKIGEKLELRRIARFDGTVETYLHRRSADLPPAVGVLVEYETGADPKSAAAAAHMVALQVAALKARYLTRDDVPEDVVASERRIAEETAKAEGRPEQAVPKIVEADLTASSRTGAAGSAVGVRQQEDRQGAARRGRCNRDAVRAVRGRPGLTGSHRAGWGVPVSARRGNWASGRRRC